MTGGWFIVGLRQLNHQGPCEKRAACIQSYIDIYPIYHELFFKQSGMNIYKYVYTLLYIYVYIYIHIYVA